MNPRRAPERVGLAIRGSRCRRCRSTAGVRRSCATAGSSTRLKPRRCQPMTVAGRRIDQGRRPVRPNAPQAHPEEPIRPASGGLASACADTWPTAAGGRGSRARAARCPPAKRASRRSPWTSRATMAKDSVPAGAGSVFVARKSEFWRTTPGPRATRGIWTNSS